MYNQANYPGKLYNYGDMGSQDQLAKILKKARLNAGLTQAEVTEKAGIHVNYYARIERAEV